MIDKEQAYIDNIDSGEFQTECIRLWGEDGHQLFDDMASVIIEEYNNKAIDSLLLSMPREED